MTEDRRVINRLGVTGENEFMAKQRIIVVGGGLAGLMTTIKIAMKTRALGGLGTMGFTSSDGMARPHGPTDSESARRGPSEY